MGLKQFNLDVNEAASTPTDRVSNIHRGDSDGEIVFTYTHHDLAPIELLALATGKAPFALSS
jgi:ubiquitin-conjugating enzyme E2 Q